MEKPHGIGLGGTRKEMWTVAHTGGRSLDACLLVGSSWEGLWVGQGRAYLILLMGVLIIFKTDWGNKSRERGLAVWEGGEKTDEWVPQKARGWVETRRIRISRQVQWLAVMGCHWCPPPPTHNKGDSVVFWEGRRGLYMWVQVAFHLRNTINCFLFPSLLPVFFFNSFIEITHTYCSPI